MPSSRRRSDSSTLTPRSAVRRLIRSSSRAPYSRATCGARARMLFTRPAICVRRREKSRFRFEPSRLLIRTTRSSARQTVFSTSAQPSSSRAAWRSSTSKTPGRPASSSSVGSPSTSPSFLSLRKCFRYSRTAPSFMRTITGRLSRTTRTVRETVPRVIRSRTRASISCSREARAEGLRSETFRKRLFTDLASTTTEIPAREAVAEPNPVMLFMGVEAPWAPLPDRSGGDPALAGRRRPARRHRGFSPAVLRRSVSLVAGVRRNLLRVRLARIAVGHRAAGRGGQDDGRADEDGGQDRGELVDARRSRRRTRPRRRRRTRPRDRRPSPPGAGSRRSAAGRRGRTPRTGGP